MLANIFIPFFLFKVTNFLFHFMYISHTTEQLSLGDNVGCWVELGQGKEWWNVSWKGGNLVFASSLWICIPVHCSSQGSACKLGSPMQMRSACRRKGKQTMFFPLTQLAKTQHCKLCDRHTPTQLFSFYYSSVRNRKDCKCPVLACCLKEKCSFFYQNIVHYMHKNMAQTQVV